MVNVSHEAAFRIVEKAMPLGAILGPIDYGDLYLFRVTGEDPFEGDLDPFYSVDMNTGELLGFSIFSAGENMLSIMDAFVGLEEAQSATDS